MALNYDTQLRYLITALNYSTQLGHSIELIKLHSITPPNYSPQLRLHLGEVYFHVLLFLVAFPIYPLQILFVLAFHFCSMAQFKSCGGVFAFQKIITISPVVRNPFHANSTLCKEKQLAKFTVFRPPTLYCRIF